MSTITEALTSTLARRDADELAAPEHAKALDGSCIEPCPGCLIAEVERLKAELHEAVEENEHRQMQHRMAEAELTAERERHHATAGRVEALKVALTNLVVWAQWAHDRVGVRMNTPCSGALLAARDIIKETTP